MSATSPTGTFTRHAAWPVVLLTLTAFLWASNQIIGRAFHEDVPPIALAIWRWIVAGVVMLPFIAGEAWRHRETIRQRWRPLVVLAFTGITVFHACTYLALQSTPAINTGLINATAPIFIPAGAYLAFRETLTMRQTLGIALSLGGVLTIISRADLGILLGLRFNPGDLWMLVAVFGWVVYSVFLKRLSRSLGLSPMVFLFVISWMGVLLLAPFYMWEMVTVGGFTLDFVNTSGIVFLGIFPSLAAMVFWNEGVARMGATKAGLFIYLVPVFTVLLAVTLLGEAFRAFHVSGTVLIVGGVVLTLIAGQSKRSPGKCA